MGYESASVFYVAGFFLTVSVESLKIVAEHALANNKTFCLNLSAPFIVDFFGDTVATALEYADFVFCNETEAAAYAKKHDLGEDLKEVALKLAASPKKNSARTRTVIFTQGSDSTIGAGDAFVGGFLAGLLAKKDMGACVEAGHFAARFIIQVSGCTLTKACDYKL